MRKPLLILFTLILFTVNVKGQGLFNFVSFSYGLFRSVDDGGYDGRFTWYNNSPATLHGLKGVWRLGQHFKIGCTLHYGNNVISSLINRQRYRMYIVETGTFLEYALRMKNKWYLSFPLQLSAGSIYIPQTYVPSKESNATSYFSMEPRVQFNKPLLDWVQASVSVGYRFMSAGKIYGSNNANLGGPSLNFSLIFGNFK